MPRPAGYPDTDTAEVEAVSVFQSLIDPKFIKAEIRTRDKVPNIDGTIEIVDEAGIPVGKLELQIRKLPDGSTKYSKCPSSLAAYSEVCTLPIIIVCVDTLNKRAFWKSISPLMPEYKEGQDTFTIHFDSNTDAVDKHGRYIKHWTGIVFDYQQRIAQYPVLRTEFECKLLLDGIREEYKKYFQIFIETVNSLFDQDFLCVKKLLFSDVWKFGIGIYAVDQQNAAYEIYKILYGKPEPLICALSADAFGSAGAANPNTVGSRLERWEPPRDPEHEGKSYVLDYVKQAVQFRKLSIHGRLISAEILFEFLDRYAHCIGLNRNLDTYTVADISDGLKNYLPAICLAIAASFDLKDGTTVESDLDMVSYAVERGGITPLYFDNPPIRVELHSRSLSLTAVHNALRYLEANEVDSVSRLYRTPSKQLGPGLHFLWEAYTQDEEEENVSLILSNAVEEYCEFIRGNRLKLSESAFLDKSMAIVYVYTPRTAVPSDAEPKVEEYQIENQGGALSKTTIVYDDTQKHEVQRDGFKVKINGQEFRLERWSISQAGFLFQETPILNLLYRMLRQDLQRHYQIGLIP